RLDLGPLDLCAVAGGAGDLLSLHRVLWPGGTQANAHRNHLTLLAAFTGGKGPRPADCIGTGWIGSKTEGPSARAGGPSHLQDGPHGRCLGLHRKRIRSGATFGAEARRLAGWRSLSASAHVSPDNRCSGVLPRPLQG